MIVRFDDENIDINDVVEDAIGARRRRIWSYTHQALERV